MSDDWLEVLRKKQSELRLVADWAAVVNYGAVRDHTRRAIAALEAVIEFRQDCEAAKAAGGGK